MSIEAMKLALEALEGLIKKTSGQAIYSFMETERRIAMSSCVGLRQAIAEAEKQEPVAMRYDFDGYGYKYIDNGSGSDWQTRIKDAEPVFAHPQPKENNE